MTRVVHYINQFFAGQGGEDSAGRRPSSGPVGPGRSLPAARATTSRSWPPSTAATTTPPPTRGGRRDPGPGPGGRARPGGRRARLHQRPLRPGLRPGGGRGQAAGLPAVAAMHADNPGLDEAGAAPVVASGEAARQMGPSLETLAAAVQKLLAGEPLTAADGRVGKAPRARGWPTAPPPSGPSTWCWPASAATGTPPRSPSPASTTSPRPRPSRPRRRHGGPPHRRRPGARRQPRRAGVGPRHPVAALPARGPTSSARASGARCTAVSRPCGPTRTPTASCPSTWPASWSARAPSAPSTRVPGHRRQRHLGGQRPPLRHRVGRRPPPVRGAGRHPHLHVRNRYALRGNACEGTRAGRHPHRAAVQPHVDRRAGGGAPHRADPRHPLPRRRPVARAGRRAGVAPPPPGTGPGGGRHPGARADHCFEVKLRRLMPDVVV